MTSQPPGGGGGGDERGYLRDGHLRGAEDASPTVPELLATDALLDRLGQHAVTEGDLYDAVARLLHGYALDADPETAGVPPLELSAIPDAFAGVNRSGHVEEAPLEDPPVEEPHVEEPRVEEPRVLVARRRTLRRLGHGTAAAAAVLALLGGTAAAAATGGVGAARASGVVSSSADAPLTRWITSNIFEVIGGTPEEHAQRELAQVRADAASGDTQAALARLNRLNETLMTVDSDPGLVQAAQDTLADLTASAPGFPVALPSSSAAPNSLEGVVAAAATPSGPPTVIWVVPMVPGAATTPPLTPGSPDPSTPAPATSPSGVSATATVGGGGPSSASSNPPRPVTTPAPSTSGSQTSKPVAPEPSDPVTGTGGSTSPSTDPTTSEPGPGVGTTPVSDPTTTPPTGAPTTTPSDPPPPGTTEPGVEEPPTVSAPVEVVSPSLPVVEPSPSAGVVPTPSEDPSEVTGESAEADTSATP